MPKKIGIYRLSDREIKYDDILSIYRFTMLKSIDINSLADIDILVIDVDDDRVVGNSNRAREINDSIPLIIVENSESHYESENILKQIIGFGKTEVVYSHDGGCYGIVEVIESIINPSLPSKKENIAIILPVFNEVDRMIHINNFMNKLMRLSEYGFPDISVYFINDGSSDYTEELIEKMVEYQNTNIDTIYNRSKFEYNSLKINTKKAGTYIDAFKRIDGSKIIFADADDSFENEDIARMINILNQGYYDIVIATKDKSAENRKAIRVLMSYMKRLLTKHLLPRGVTDSQTGLKAFNQTSANYILPYLDPKYGLAIDLKILNVAKKYRFRVFQLPVKCIDRDGSHVNIVKDSIKFIKSIVSITFE